MVRAEPGVHPDLLVLRHQEDDVFRPVRVLCKTNNPRQSKPAQLYVDSCGSSVPVPSNTCDYLTFRSFLTFSMCVTSMRWLQLPLVANPKNNLQL